MPIFIDFVITGEPGIYMFNKLQILCMQRLVKSHNQISMKVELFLSLQKLIPTKENKRIHGICYYVTVRNNRSMKSFTQIASRSTDVTHS